MSGNKRKSGCTIPESSLRRLVGRVTHILRQLKINLLDMDAALPDEALRPSMAHLEKRSAWRAFVKSAGSIYEVSFFSLCSFFLVQRNSSLFVLILLKLDVLLLYSKKVESIGNYFAIKFQTAKSTCH